LSFPPPFPLCSSLFLLFFLSLLSPSIVVISVSSKTHQFSAVLHPWPIVHCRHATHHQPFLGFEVAHRSGSFKARSVSPHQSRPQTRPTTMLQDLPSSRGSSPSRHLVTTRRRMAKTRLRVDLTCPRVSLARRRIYAPQRRVDSPDSGSTTLPRYSNCYLVSSCISVVFKMFFHFFACVLCWFFVGSFASDHPSTDSTELFAVLAWQQHACCFYRNRLFSELVCIYNRLVRP
jgi:hypothetical protein